MQFPIAVHAMLMLAYFPEVRMTSDLISESVGCHPVVIRKVFARLKAHDLILVKPGPGGAKLARDRSEITLWDIYAAVEPDDASGWFEFPPHTSGACPVGSNIRGILLGHLDDAVASFRSSLEAVTLEDMAGELEHTYDRDPAVMFEEMTKNLVDLATASE